MTREVRKGFSLPPKTRLAGLFNGNRGRLFAALVVVEGLLICGMMVVAAIIISRNLERGGAPTPAGVARGGAGTAPSVKPNQAGAPTLDAPLPTDACGEPGIVFSGKAFLVQDLEIGSPVPSTGMGGVVFRYPAQGYFFVFGPDSGNLDLARAVRAGDLASFTGPDCSTISFNLLPAEVLPEFDLAREAAGAEQIALVFQQRGGEQGYLVRGSAVIGEPIPTAVILPGQPAIEAEISLIGATISTDGTALEVRVAVRNYGSAPFTLSREDIRLISGDPAGQAPLRVDPALPRAFDPGGRVELALAFSLPPVSEPVLRIFDAEIIIERN